MQYARANKENQKELLTNKFELIIWFVSGL